MGTFRAGEGVSVTEPVQKQMTGKAEKELSGGLCYDNSIELDQRTSYRYHCYSGYSTDCHIGHLVGASCLFCRDAYTFAGLRLCESGRWPRPVCHSNSTPARIIQCFVQAHQ